MNDPKTTLYRRVTNKEMIDAVKEHGWADAMREAFPGAVQAGNPFVPVEATDLWDDKTIADAESLLEDSDENRDLVADILAVAARQFTEKRTSMTQVNETDAAIAAVAHDYDTAVNPILVEIAASLAVIADALAWQVEQEIHDRSLKAMGDG